MFHHDLQRGEGPQFFWALVLQRGGSRAYDEVLQRCERARSDNINHGTRDGALPSRSVVIDVPKTNLVVNLKVKIKDLRDKHT